MSPPPAAVRSSMIAATRQAREFAQACPYGRPTLLRLRSPASAAQPRTPLAGAAAGTIAQTAPREQGAGGGAGATMSTRAVGAATVLAALGAVVIIAIAAWDSRGGSDGGDGGEAFVVERAPAETATPARGYANGAARPGESVNHGSNGVEAVRR